MASEQDWIRRCAAHPGSEWRVLAHDGDREVQLANQGTFDELVVDHWLHVEQIDERTWWARVGDARLMIRVDDVGDVTVDIERGFYGVVRGGTRAHEAPENA